MQNFYYITREREGYDFRKHKLTLQNDAPLDLIDRALRDAFSGDSDWEYVMVYEEGDLDGEE